MLISYNWLKWYISEIPPAEKMHDIFTFHICEVDDVVPIRADGSIETDPASNGISDYIFDLAILPNRAHDLLSHSGVARELCGVLGLNFNDPDRVYKIPEAKPTKLEVKLETDKCSRYMGRVVRGIKIGPSPEWVVKHLESIGQRSINNIVDATNLVMYNCGNPTHAFDLSRINSPLEEYSANAEGGGMHPPRLLSTESTPQEGNNPIIVVKNANEGDELKLVGREGIVVKLKNNDLVITSPRWYSGEGSGGEANLALAGIKGGFDSGVNDGTTEILLEVANFDSVTVRKTRTRLNIFTDSAKRFENEFSSDLCAFAMKELSALIYEMFPDAIFEDIVDVYPSPEVQKTVKFKTEYISKMLGLEVSNQTIEKFMHDYGFGYANDFEKGEWTVTIPTYRRDLENDYDMIEEIGRYIGYDKVVPVLPQINGAPKHNEVYENIVKARNVLVHDGYREVMTYSFTNKGDVEVLASASDKNFLRTNLTDGIKESFNLNKLNAPFLGLNEVKIFEIGTVFSGDKEEIHVCFANKKEVKEMMLQEFVSVPPPLGKGRIEEGSDQNSTPSAFGISPLVRGRENALFKPWSTFPFMTRDISVWVPENVEADELKDIYKEFGTELLVREPQLVDKFTKPSAVPGEEGRTSYAFRLVFQSYEKTLTDDEVNVIMANITDKISNLGYQVR